MKITKFGLYLLFALSSFGQINQTHPELCGKPDGAVPVPPNISAIVDRSTGQADLFVRMGGSSTKVHFPEVVDEINEACQLSDDRLILFGKAGHLTNVAIINSKNASLLDSFYTIDPAMSPNQRWLIYRKFYPRHTEFPVSEEYLLYDLTKTAAQNRPPGVDVDNRSEVGHTVFPLGQTNLPGDNIDVPENQQHQSRSSFFWEPDSRAVVFGDSVQDQFTLVLVTIDSTGKTAAYSRSVQTSEACRADLNINSTNLLSIDHLEVEGSSTDGHLVRAGFRSDDGACVKTLTVDWGNFKSAKTEVHMRKKPKRESIEGH